MSEQFQAAATYLKELPSDIQMTDNQVICQGVMWFSQCL
jgi:hypothetical protein